jgi:hypothetical protein
MSGKTFALNSNVKNHSDDTQKGGYYGYACFVICGSCFWCASDLSGGSRTTKCHGCDAIDKIESIPLAPKEKYFVELDPQHGITLDFAPR